MMKIKKLRRAQWVYLILSIFLLTSILVGYLFLLRNNKLQDLELYSQKIELGEIAAGEKRNFDVSIRNPNRFSVTILKISTSCGCTKAFIDDKSDSIVMPAMSLKKLGVFIDESMHEEGETIDHEIYILTDKPLSKEYKIKVVGRVI